MTRLAKARPYRSELRDAQADGTRARILDAALRVMARGVASLSMPAVAREAGVSVPTVYRHFGTKPDLLAALHPHLMRRVGMEEVVGPRSLEALREGVHEIFDRVDRLASLDDLARVAMVSPSADEGRRLSMPRRLERARALLDTAEPKLSRADRDHLARGIVVLLASSSLRIWREFLGVSVDQATDDVTWIVRAAIAGASTRRKNR
jgi:AcrR family transcriptional regulator